MERSAATLAPVRQGLKALADRLIEIAGIVQHTDALLGTLNFSDSPPGDSASPESVQDSSTSSALLPSEAAVLDRLKQQVEDLSRTVRVELNPIVNAYYRMDLQPLLDHDVCKHLQSFQLVPAEMLRETLTAFMETGGERERADLELFLKVGAELDTPVKVHPYGSRPQNGPQGGLVEETALLRAVVFGSVEAVKMLLQAGAGLEACREVVGDWGGERALHIACREGRPEIAEILVDGGAEVNAVTSIGLRPLYYAAQGGDAGLVKFLLTRDADLHAQIKDGRLDGRTCIFDAIGYGHKDVVELLLDHGANLDVREERQQTPLFFAAQFFADVPRDHREIAELLVSRGADVTARNNCGETVLHSAARSCFSGVFDLMLQKGLDFYARDNEGHTPLYHVPFVEGDGQTEEETSLLRAVTLGSLEAVKIVVRGGAGLEVRREVPDVDEAKGETALSTLLVKKKIRRSPRFF
uniref:Uncharacterized protein n=1 Tax=Chromera velia CCMP2878 TaxID=1169474 RepID=A0A0G4HQ67_9ALVE|eukprot:Cvel_30070.t1-p1 / transcript=Cvel_30070.t1 / gene=Cvel_30070 / organism=Chromera_velia_CCMP2878 / gene_product=Putative ankyrin repeat protein RF_0381, putative / transcript_product=Putative ankyrin repeat protein RF_0381, putative / location=Cvel_scaffold4232:8051-9454(-) / protein_length=468 / sequence_SO=supercontig / SO=protein_coding / is_pseudo=false